MILKSPILEVLLDQFKLQDFDENDNLHLNALNKLSIQLIVAGNGALTATAPLEKHPYLVPLVASDNIKGLMIGTFPPISYMCDSYNLPNLHFGKQKITAPDYPFFHGNVGALWTYTPVNNGYGSSISREDSPREIKIALRNYYIEYTDIISYCQRSLQDDVKYSSLDSLINNISINNEIYPFIMDSVHLNRLYFTNASFFSSHNKLFNKIGCYSLSQRDAFGLFLKGAHDLGYILEISMPANPLEWININEETRPSYLIKEINTLLLKKVVVFLKLSKSNITKVFTIYSALSPAAVNRGKVRVNKCVINYSNLYKESIEESPKLLLELVIKDFFAGDIHNLSKLND
jgi:hypothetical protein